VGGEQDGGDDPGRGRGHEALGEARRPAVGVPEEAVAFLGGGAQVRVLHLRDGLRRVPDAGRVAPPAGQHLRVVGEVDQVAGGQAPARAPEAAHAPGHVGREAGAGLLAVVAHVDADFELSCHDVRHRGVGLPRERGRVHRLAAVVADEQVTQRGWPREAAHVGGEDAPVAALHEPVDSRSSFCSQSSRSAFS
jgi:hypothetical protein